MKQYLQEPAMPFRLASTFVLLMLCGAPRDASAQQKFKQTIKQDVRQDAHVEPEATGDEIPMPSRETLERSDLPGPVKCALLCANVMQACTTRCKGSSSCSQGCYKNYGECAQRCGGPIGTDP